MGADNFVSRSSLTGKGSLSGGSNWLRKVLFVLRVFNVLRVFPTTSFLSRSMGMESAKSVHGVIVEDEDEVALSRCLGTRRPAKGVLEFGHRLGAVEAVAER